MGVSWRRLPVNVQMVPRDVKASLPGGSVLCAPWAGVAKSAKHHQQKRRENVRRRVS
jgi:hypothetical protein